MKTSIKLLAIVAFIAMNISNINAQIKVESDGYIGVGTASPQTDVHLYGSELRLQVSGSYNPIPLSVYQYYDNTQIYPLSTNKGFIGNSSHQFYYGYFRYLYANGVYLGSDSRYKKNIKDIENGWAIKTLNKLVPKKYDLIEVSNSSAQAIKDKESKMCKDIYGFIAQDVESVLPEVVLTNDDSLGMKSINYMTLIPIMVKAFQEQQEIIELQAEKIKELEKNINKSDKSSSNKSADLSTNTESNDNTIDGQAMIYQNSPNPFTFDTEIKYYLPKGSNNAFLYVFNLQGNLQMTETLSATGNGSIIINGSELNPGMYVYSLIVDGQEVDTKRMILTE